MLILVSVALAVVAVVFLIVGLVAVDGLLLIYLSVFSSAAAGVVLYAAVRLPADVTPEVTVPSTITEFPIADYDALTDVEVRRLLPDLYAVELDFVADHERSGAARTAVLNGIAQCRASAVSS